MRIALVLSILAATVVVATADPPAVLQPARGPDQPRQAVAPPSTDEEVRALKQQLRALEDEVARLRASVTEDALTGMVYGPAPLERAPVPPYTQQATVLAERGVPSRVEWGSQRRVLYYGLERWEFDDQGQLIGVRRDP